MHPSVQDKEERLWYCGCGAVKEFEGQIGSAEKINRKEVGEGVIKDRKTKGGFPHKCRKCGYGLADIETISAFYSGESDISLYRCKECGHVERETDGTSNAF